MSMKMKAKTGVLAVALVLGLGAAGGAAPASAQVVPSVAKAGSSEVVWNSGTPTFTCSGRDQYVLLQWKRAGGTTTGYRFVDLWVHGTLLNNTKNGSGIQSVYTGLKYATYYEIKAIGGGTIEWATLGCYTRA